MEKSERKIKWNALATFLLALLLCAGAAKRAAKEREKAEKQSSASKKETTVKTKAPKAQKSAPVRTVRRRR